MRHVERKFNSILQSKWGLKILFYFLIKWFQIQAEKLLWNFSKKIIFNIIVFIEFWSEFNLKDYLKWDYFNFGKR